MHSFAASPTRWKIRDALEKIDIGLTGNLILTLFVDQQSGTISYSCRNMIMEGIFVIHE